MGNGGLGNGQGEARGIKERTSVEAQSNKQLNYNTEKEKIK